MPSPRDCRYSAAGAAHRRWPAAQRWRTHRPTKRRPDVGSTATSATSSGNVLAAVRAACIQSQSLPSCTGRDAADSASMKPTSSSVMPPTTTGASAISGTSTSSAEVLGVPPPGQRQPAAATTAAMRQADCGGYPVVDRRHRDDVDVRRGNTRRGQRDRPDPTAGPAVQPDGDGHQRGGQHRTGADPDLRAQNAGLGGQHQQQHDADERDRDARDGERLADPAVGRAAAAAWEARRRRRWRRYCCAALRRVVRRVLRPVRRRRAAYGTRGGAGGRAAGAGRCREQAVQLAQVGGRPRQLLAHHGEIRGEPGDHGLIRFGHGAIVAANPPARMSSTTRCV